jgi:hypothetical protein
MKASDIQKQVQLFLNESGTEAALKAEKQLLEAREQAFAETVFSVLSSNTSTQQRTALLRLCWENGADFSAFSEQLIDLVKSAPWEEAIEAFSVIESMEPSRLPSEKKERDLNRILDNFDKMDEQRRSFAARLIELYDDNHETTT